MSELTPTERSLRASVAVHTSWANTADRSARTAPARQALQERFEREVDPSRALPEAERRLRAESARKAHYKRLAFLSAKARRKAG